MLSTVDLRKLILEKKHEIEKEKIRLGIAEPTNKNKLQDLHNDAEQINTTEEVKGGEEAVPCQRDEAETKEDKEANDKRNLYDFAENNIPPDLEKYIRRYLGLPVMLKAGEYSPNNPLIRGERTSGDALLGLGEYERRRNTLRKIRQQQYREYLDEQAKKKQEAKEQAERERRERDEKERLREERENERLHLERERRSPDRRASLNFVPSTSVAYSTKTDTGIQVNGVAKPLSVAVQTDDADLFHLSPVLSKCGMTEAERELSPRTVADGDLPAHRWETHRRKSYGDYHDTSTVNKSNRDRLVSDLRHSYMPSIFDADAIRLRNLQAEKEAAAKRQFYQQELKNQILEQQRIKEERKSREKLLEQAEMRRLEEQLRMLNVAQDREIMKQYDITAQMKENSLNYEKNRTELQKEIDIENRKLFHIKSQPSTRPDAKCQRSPATSKSDDRMILPSRPPFHNYPPKIKKPNDLQKSTLLPSNYDVDRYLRRNLNFNINKTDFNSDSNNNHDEGNRREIIQNEDVCIGTYLMPVLKHSPTNETRGTDNNNLSDAMKRVDDKWKVPAVEKSTVKKLSNEDGKCLSILTQLGSIRKQLQLEQLKLDKMVVKNDM